MVIGHRLPRLAVLFGAEVAAFLGFGAAGVAGFPGIGDSAGLVSGVLLGPARPGPALAVCLGWSLGQLRGIAVPDSAGLLLALS